jgi:N,N'-diacetylbacillosaminyl-diphospho-undecaprenol alpha-1,3-N-acetylgalactosaminyltransferase
MVVNDDFSAWHFRKGLIAALVARGDDVTVVSPEGPYVARLTALGAKHVAVPVFRFVSPLSDLRYCIALYRVFRCLRPDIVHNITVKPNTFGTVAAYLAGVPQVVILVSGLGYAFDEGGGLRKAIVRSLVSLLYRMAGRLAHRVWFQNSDDFELFVRRGLVVAEKGVVILGSGIDTVEYSPDAVPTDAVRNIRRELNIQDDQRVVLMMVARVVWSKGVREFVEASERLAAQGHRVVLVLVGPLDPGSPDEVTRDYLLQKLSEHFRWVGFRSDVRELLASADIVALPSYYREGLPRFLLEGAAMGKPIVTTENVGCKEVVKDGINGFLVPTKDPESLAAAVARLLDSAQLRATFGAESRTRAVNEFEDRVVVQRVFEEVYRWQVSSSPRAQSATVKEAGA